MPYDAGALQQSRAGLDAESTHATRSWVKQVLSVTVVATGGADHSIQLLDAETGVVAAALAGHSKKVTALAFAGPDVLVSGGADGSVRSWQRSDDDKWVQQFSHTLPDTIVAVRAPPLNPPPVFIGATPSCVCWCCPSSLGQVLACVW